MLIHDTPSVKVREGKPNPFISQMLDDMLNDAKKNTAKSDKAVGRDAQ